MKVVNPTLLKLLDVIDLVNVLWVKPIVVVLLSVMSLVTNSHRV